MATSTLPQKTPDPACWLEDHGDYLYSFALVRVRDAGDAEDVVQETLLRAFQGLRRYRGQASFRTWLTAILRNQIADLFRKRARSEKIEEDAVLDRLFDAGGKWRVKVPAWKDDPAAALETAEFWSVFRACLQRLPARMGDVFTLRVLEQMETEDVGDQLELKPNHVLVLLHRARLRLWNCLSLKWLRAGQQS